MGLVSLQETQEAPSPLVPCEDTERRWLFMHQEVGPHQTLILSKSSRLSGHHFVHVRLWGLTKGS